MDGESSATSNARLRAEIRRRKILQRGDERINLIFGRSQDEEPGTDQPMSDKKSENDRLIEQILKDKDTEVTGTSELIVEESDNILNERPIVEDDIANQSITSDRVKTRPFIDKSLFESYERRHSIRQPHSHDLSRAQIWLLQLLHFYSTKSHLMLLIVFKSVTACLCSYHNYNICIPFLIAHITSIVYLNMLQTDSLNWIKIAFQFVRGLFTEFPTFAFIYILVQALKLS